MSQSWYNLKQGNWFYIICEEVDTMCNLGQGIEDRATEKTLKSVVMKMYNNRFSIEQISIATDKSVEEIRKIIEKNDKVLVQEC